MKKFISNSTRESGTITVSPCAACEVEHRDLIIQSVYVRFDDRTFTAMYMCPIKNVEVYVSYV